MLMRVLSKLLSTLLLASVCASQAVARVAPLPPLPPVPPVRPLIVAPKAERPIQLDSVQVGSVVEGGMARTTLRLVFFNPNQRMLEGELQFPLAPGQQISGFALDIDGLLRPAVPVDKARGRQILEEVTRRRVDPALLEQTQGNNFKLRIYPIAALGRRTVELTYTESLMRDNGSWVYRLPMGFGDLAQGIDVALSVNGAAGAPLASGALGDVVFSGADGVYRAHVVKNNFSANGVLKLLVPASAAPQTYVQEFDGATYFAAEIPVANLRTPRVLPKVVGLLWDSSGSGSKRALEAELFELDKYFKALGNAEVRLLRLRDRPEAQQVFKIAGGNWDALRKALAATIYDGASALADWAPQADVNEYLLVSDGLSNYGLTRFPVLNTGQRLYAINSALSADTSRLDALAERSGGCLVQVDAGAPGAAAAQLLSDGLQVRLASAVGATEVLVDGQDPQQGLLRIAGKLSNPTAQVVLNVVQQGKTRQVRLDIAANSAQQGLAAPLWAATKLRQLEADYELNRAAIRRLGTQFSMPTRETSLIVLDRLEDYLRYDIAPPAQYLAAYGKLKALRGGDLAQRRQKHLDSVLRQFEQKSAWWETTYPKDGKLRQKMMPQQGSDASRGQLGEPAMAPAPMALSRPAPAPITARATDQAGESRRVDVTGSMLRRSAPMPAPRPSSESASAASPEIGIALQKWRADAPYITRMNAASADTLYAVYLDEKPSYANSSAFYLDAADMLFDKGQRDLALRVLSNLAEMDLENRHVLRILAYRLLQAGAPQLAIPVLEKVQLLAEEEPQSFRDLGLALAAAGKPQQAIDQLVEVVVRPWDDRFAEIELITLAEMNAIIAANRGLDTRRIDPRLLKNMPLDVRAVLTWDADNSDMDLWVTDPDGERCFYGYPLTYQGGRLSRDFTGGYGPEEFSLRHAKPGKYRIEANFFGSTQQLVAAATTLQVKLTTGFGTPKAKQQMITLRLKGRGETVLVGEFEVAK